MIIMDEKGQEIELVDGVIGTSRPALVTSMPIPDGMPQYFIIIAVKKQGPVVSNNILIPGLDYTVGETSIDFLRGMDYTTQICFMELATGTTLEPFALAKLPISYR